MAVGLNPDAVSRHRTAWFALIVVVLAAHGCVTQQVAERIADVDRAQAMPERIEVAYVRDMNLSAPPPAAAPAAAPAGRRGEGP